MTGQRVEPEPLNEELLRWAVLTGPDPGAARWPEPFPWHDLNDPPDEPPPF